MTHKYRRCSHCRRVYVYQASGPGCGDSLNDGRFCPTCIAVVYEALKAVPVAVERFKEDVTGDERELVLARQRTVNSIPCDPSAPHGLVVRQIRPGLFDMKTGAEMCVQVIHIDNVEYDVSTWSDKREPAYVTRTMERDLETGVTRPWRDF